MSEADKGTVPPDLHEQVAYALLRPAARLGHAFRVSLREMGNQMQLASFHELQTEGLKMREIAERLGISMRKVALLSKQLKRTFFDSYQHAELPRRIEFLLWAKPLSRVRIIQALPEVPESDIDDALIALAKEARISEVRRASSTVYQRIDADVRLVSDHLIARIDGLHTLMSSVYNTVAARFFANDERSFARTMSVQLRPEDICELNRLYEDVIRRRIIELEGQSRDCDDAVNVELSILWAPSDSASRVGSVPSHKTESK